MKKIAFTLILIATLLIQACKNRLKSTSQVEADASNVMEDSAKKTAQDNEVTDSANSYDYKQLPDWEDSTSFGWRSINEFAFVFNHRYIVFANNSSDFVPVGSPNRINQLGKKNDTNENGEEVSDVDYSRLPPFYKNLLNKEYNVFSDRGKIYKVKIIALKLLTTAKTSCETTIFLAGEFHLNIPKEKDNFYCAMPQDRSAFTYVPISLKQTSYVNRLMCKELVEMPSYKLIQHQFDSAVGHKKSNIPWWKLKVYDIDYRYKPKEGASLFQCYQGCDGKIYGFVSHYHEDDCPTGFFSRSILSMSKLKFTSTNIEIQSPEIIGQYDWDFGLMRPLMLIDIDKDHMPEFLIKDGESIWLIKKENNEWVQLYAMAYQITHCVCC